MNDGSLEILRRKHYEALAELAERYGFKREECGVSVGPQFPGDLEKGKVTLDMQMPAKLAHILSEKGFFKDS